MNWFHKKAVIVPFDFSEPSYDAIRCGLKLVDNPTSLCVVNVLPPVVSGDPGFRWNVMDAATRKLQIRSELDKHEIPDIDIAVAFGDAGEQIVGVAEERQADLIIIPSHGRRGLAHLLFGSVAERVTRLAHCNVLVLRRTK